MEEKEVLRYWPICIITLFGVLSFPLTPDVIVYSRGLNLNVWALGKIDPPAQSTRLRLLSHQTLAQQAVWTSALPLCLLRK